jgi:hypothetical protein
MFILIDDKEFEVENANWEVKEIIHYPKFRSIYETNLNSYSPISYFINYFYIKVNKNCANNILKILLSKNEYKIEFDGNCANFYTTADNVIKLISLLEHNETDTTTIKLVGTFARECRKND